MITLTKNRPFRCLVSRGARGLLAAQRKSERFFIGPVARREISYGKDKKKRQFLPD